MRLSSIGYTFWQGIKNILRNKWFSLASVATMTACIFMFGLFYSILVNFDYIVKSAEEGVAVTVFFEEGLAQEEIDRIGQEILDQPQVSEITYISAEEAWKQYQQKYFKDAPELAEGFQEDNPLGGSANYEVYVSSIEEQGDLVGYIEGLAGVRKVNQSEAAADALSTFNVLVGYISIGISVILLLVAVFLISNTVATGISVRKEEIGIMKLIGAKDSFVRAPFLIEGMLIGLVGSLIPLVILYSVYRRVVVYILGNYTLLTDVIKFLPVEQVFAVLLPVAVLLGLGIGFLGSAITIRKHLKV